MECYIGTTNISPSKGIHLGNMIVFLESFFFGQGQSYFPYSMVFSITLCVCRVSHPGIKDEFFMISYVKKGRGHFKISFQSFILSSRICTAVCTSLDIHSTSQEWVFTLTSMGISQECMTSVYYRRKDMDIKPLACTPITRWNINGKAPMLEQQVHTTVDIPTTSDDEIHALTSLLLVSDETLCSNRINLQLKKVI